ncbi:hypothetical protein KL932_004628 [Ogataea haglerorum]|nr:hypothetical protein KL932_004628 [Ogataea haglerorum]
MNLQKLSRPLKATKQRIGGDTTHSGGSGNQSLLAGKSSFRVEDLSTSLLPAPIGTITPNTRPNVLWRTSKQQSSGAEWSIGHRSQAQTCVCWYGMP